jgi:hypothetical protein
MIEELKNDVEKAIENLNNFKDGKLTGDVNLENLSIDIKMVNLFFSQMKIITIPFENEINDMISEVLSEIDLPEKDKEEIIAGLPIQQMSDDIQKGIDSGSSLEQILKLTKMFLQMILTLKDEGGLGGIDDFLKNMGK